MPHLTQRNVYFPRILHWKKWTSLSLNRKLVLQNPLNTFARHIVVLVIVFFFFFTFYNYTQTLTTKLCLICSTLQTFFLLRFCLKRYIKIAQILESSYVVELCDFGNLNRLFLLSLFSLDFFSCLKTIWLLGVDLLCYIVSFNWIM